MPNRARLSEKNVKFFLNLAGKYHRKYGLPFDGKDDRVQSAVMAVLRLAKRYNGAAPFIAVATQRIKWELFDYVKAWKRTDNHGRNIVPASRPLNVENIPDKHDYHAEVDAWDFIDNMLARVRNHKHRCALALIAAGMTNEGAAVTVGMTPARIPQLMKSKYRPLARVLIGEAV